MVEQAAAVAASELSPYPASSRAEQTAALVTHRLGGATVHPKRAGGPQRKRDPMLAAFEARARRQDQCTNRALRVERGNERVGVAARRDNHADSGARRLPRGLELRRHPAAAERSRAFGHEATHLGFRGGGARDDPRAAGAGAAGRPAMVDVRRLSRPRPAAIAPDVTSMTSRPPPIIESIWPARLSITSARRPSGSESTALPTLTTTRRVAAIIAGF